MRYILLSSVKKRDIKFTHSESRGQDVSCKVTITHKCPGKWTRINAASPFRLLPPPQSEEAQRAQHDIKKKTMGLYPPVDSDNPSNTLSGTISANWPTVLLPPSLSLLRRDILYLLTKSLFPLPLPLFPPSTDVVIKAGALLSRRVSYFLIFRRPDLCATF